ncbi:hypothetical protein [Shinella sumterensis]|uniref:Nucleotidyltransferase AbiEii toxin of type IV toxin-antitoxin system n=1 Tax=Shinella sumterensis TaxID=1967501 RepID=A0AA50H7B1_9HYPH|nr:hypothetical protein [Shinella sumterensis]WLS00875.1 hypothetical protein Q9313_25370 [Shinella sumterensis]
MLTGIDKFREYFADYEDRYATIGGAACDLLFGEAGLDLRATKDIDMVLCVEVVDIAFGKAFRAFLDAGGYQARERSTGDKEFYRFHKPSTADFPFMIELFARKPGTLELPEDAELTPIPVEEDVVSLSAILLDDSYYDALQSAKRKIGSVTIVDETLLIPFKARAFLDLGARAASGEKIDSKNIRKHRNDVFRLAQLLPRSASIALPDQIQADMQRFLDLAQADETLDPKAFDVSLSRDEAIALLRTAYRLTGV